MKNNNFSHILVTSDNISVLKRESVRLHEEILHHLYLSFGVISWSISRGWSVEHLVRMGEMRNSSLFFVGKPE
jgi:hypothetical protein